MKQILNRVPSPPGALPPQAQSWLLAGLAAVIAITLVTFPGQADKPTTDAAPSGPAAGAAGPGTPVGVDSVESAARRLQQDAERNAEARLRKQLGKPEPRPDGLPRAPEPVQRQDAAHGPPAAVSTGPDDVTRRIEDEERLRRYRSLSAPTLVQSRRGDRVPSLAPEVEQPAELPGMPADESPVTDSETAADAAVPGPASADPGTRLRWLRAGEFLEAILTNRLSGDFSGPVNAMVSADVYDRSRQHVLVPGGTRALGSASRIEDWDQVRLAVRFQTLVFPDGRAVPLGETEGLNQMGETGLRDRVDRHLPSAVAAAGAVGALAGLSQAVSPQDALLSRLGDARVSAGTGLSRAAERILERYLNRLPTVTIREGHRIRIYLIEDLRLPAYPARRDRNLPLAAGLVRADGPQGGIQ